ncbi:MAG TPA: PBP1A family penicillin-binding protein [Bryobacteraceae bacterium]|nr:PBP1A family penicillin-binding protein [Bryobacteraceae bacterium]
MPVKVQVPRRALLVRFILSPLGKAFTVTLLAIGALGVLVFAWFWFKYSRLIDEKLSAGPFANTSMLFAAPTSIGVGDTATPQDIGAALRRSGYSESDKNRLGYYILKSSEIDIYPGPDSYFEPEGGVIKFSGNRVSQIISLRDNTDRPEYLLEPELISNLFDKNREKRRIVRYADVPEVLRNAVISAEDKRFYQHSGFDPLRIIKSAWVDFREGRRSEGASTVTQQVARMFWLDNRKTIRRKLAEVMISIQLEGRLTKEQIFEYYVNQVDLGHRGSFDIRGVGEAAQVYFGKDVSRVSLPEAALLAGLIQQPSRINPYRWPDRALARRNVVLTMMHENGYINDRQFEEAENMPLNLAHSGMESTDAPYFVDMVNDVLSDKFEGRDFQTRPYRVYTTLDLRLQHDAAEAVRLGMAEVDKLIAGRRRRDPSYPEPQCALIALDPHTGEIRAFVGGRNYGVSQLDHILAKRQPGSSFKPFVYATALDSAVDGGQPLLTPVSLLNDTPTTFWFDNKPYEPNNFKGEFMGTVTLRTALAHSLNVATVQLAEEVGYGNVVNFARRAGLNMDIHATPAVALGAYEVTPLEIAGAYTVFANGGVYVKPSFLNSVRDQDGTEIFRSQMEKRGVLDPRIAYMMVNLMEEVLRSGTGVGVHARGFNLPAAGKTGTSRDGWFAGFTSKMLCIVWVGFDDGRELNLEGAHSALPIWTEFMKRAAELPEYRNVSQFQPPSGVVGVPVDPQTGELATASCPKVITEYFVDGTQPVESCHLHGGGGGAQVAGWDTGTPEDHTAGAPPSRNAVRQPQQARSVPPQNAPPQQQPQPEKKSFFRRLRDLFK